MFNRKLLLLSVLIMALLIPISITAFTPRLNVTGYNSDYAYDIIEELSSEKYKGRRYGTSENMEAVNYIAQQFESIGLQPLGDNNTYLKNYKEISRTYSSIAALELLDKDGRLIKQYTYGKDFREFAAALSKPGDITAEYELINFQPRHKLRAANVNGSIAISNTHGMNNVDNDIFTAAYSSKFRALIVTVPDSYNLRRESASVRNKLLTQTGYEMPTLVIKESVYNDLNDYSSLGYKLHLRTTLDAELTAIADVIGMIPAKSNKYLLITSHIDHVGPGSDGYFYPGALDNASGIAIMTEIARFIKSQDIVPKINIVFIAFNGEEGGLLGSMRYANLPLFPLENTSVINLDMLGSNSDLPITIMYNKAYYHKYGAELDPSKVIRRDFQELAEKISLPMASKEEMSSDHTYFNLYGIPAVTLIEYDKDKIHTENDDMTNISQQRIDSSLKLIISYIAVKAFPNISVYGFSPLFRNIRSVVLAVYPLLSALVILNLLYYFIIVRQLGKRNGVKNRFPVVTIANLLLIVALISYISINYNFFYQDASYSIKLLTTGVISILKGVVIVPIYVFCLLTGWLIVLLGKSKINKCDYEGNRKEYDRYHHISLFVTTISSLIIAFAFNGKQYKAVSPEFAQSILGILIFYFAVGIISYFMYRLLCREINFINKSYLSVFIYSLILFIFLASFYMPIATNEYVRDVNAYGTRNLIESPLEFNP